MQAFRQGLSQSGYVEGRNLAIEARWAEGQNSRLPDFASELTRRPVALIATHGPGALAAKAATTTIPIVFLTGGDPVQIGLVKSLQRPDGNLTGVSDLNVEVASKRLELLRELVPRANRFALLVNPANSARAETVIRETQAAASILGVQLEVLNASTESELDAVFAKISSLNVGGLVIGADAFFAGRANDSARSQRSARYPRSSYIATSLWLAVSPPTGPTPAICSGKSAFTVAGYSRAKSRLICRSTNRPKSS